MNSLERAIKVLEIMGRHSAGLTNSQISRYLNISTSSTSYLLSQLEREGCVKRDEDTGRYQVGLRLLSLAHGALRATGLQGVSEAVLYDLAEATRLTAAIGVLERTDVVFIQKIHRAENAENPSTAPFQVRRFPNAKCDVSDRGVETAVAGRASLLDNASGRVLLAFLSPEEAMKLLALESHAARETRVLAAVSEELKRISVLGYAVADCGRVRSVAAPIKTRNGAVRAVLAVSGSRSSPVWEDLCNVVNLVREAACKISKKALNSRLQPGPELPPRVPRAARAVAEVR